MRFLCKIGCHKFDSREIHVEEKLDDKKVFLASVIERCRCGTGRFAIFGSGTKPTSIIVPTKFSG